MGKIRYNSLTFYLRQRGGTAGARIIDAPDKMVDVAQGASRTLRELGEAKTAYALLTDRLEDVRKTDVFQVHIHPDYEWYSGQ